MNIEDLYTFKVVAEKQSISHATEKLNTAQSNITTRIKRLEADYGDQLFYRHRKGVTLTPIGIKLLKYAKDILHLVEQSKREITYSNSPIGTLKIGSMETTAAVRLPAILSDFHDRYPKVELNLETNTTEELIKLVLSRELDGAFIASKTSNSTLKEIPVFREHLELLSKGNTSSINTLEAIQTNKIIVFKSGCFYRKVLEDWLLSNGIVPKNIMELNTLDGIIGCVKAGLGITMLTKSVLDQLDSKVGLIQSPVPYQDSEVVTHFIYRKDTIETFALRKFIELLDIYCNMDSIKIS